MESFFLSETSKYLFLLGANATQLPDFYVLTTEGHLLPPLPTSAARGAGLGSGAAPMLAEAQVTCLARHKPHATGNAHWLTGACNAAAMCIAAEPFRPAGVATWDSCSGQHASRVGDNMPHVFGTTCLTSKFHVCQWAGQLERTQVMVLIWPNTSCRCLSWKDQGSSQPASRFRQQSCQQWHSGQQWRPQQERRWRQRQQHECRGSRAKQQQHQQRWSSTSGGKQTSCRRYWRGKAGAGAGGVRRAVPAAGQRRAGGGGGGTALSAAAAQCPLRTHAATSVRATVVLLQPSPCPASATRSGLQSIQPALNFVWWKLKC